MIRVVLSEADIAHANALVEKALDDAELDVPEQEFIPTCHELSVIARYWLRERLKVRFDWFCFQQVGGEWRIELLASRRLDRIGPILGAEAIQKLEREVRSELEAKYPQAWKNFLDSEGPDGLPVPSSQK
jgi:hypothetical protein